MPKLIESNGLFKFEGFPEIQNTSIIKSLISDLLNVRED